jgi:hypothetical protein
LRWYAGKNEYGVAAEDAAIREEPHAAKQAAVSRT